MARGFIKRCAHHTRIPMHCPTPSPHFVQLHQADLAGVRAELAEGLLAQPAHVAPKFFYDALGSRLFDAITELAEYYPTRTEATGAD
jgi:L-histidine Nalpha-methyltransferase